ncbi:MAG: hypothetical protein JOZ96_26185 [Acidobacteria bacterium]|nr:hypothetical protein [Acidobacteriota bacterium]
MLTEDDKKRIREEEVYRQEVRRELEAEKPGPSGGQRLWEVFNKPLVLWFLSTILVGFISWMYASREAQNKELSQRTEAIRKLDREIRNRVGGSLKYLDKPQQGHQPLPPYDVFDGVLLSLDKNNGEYAASLYPEYKDKGFQALVTDLKGLVGDDEQADLEKALATYDELKNSRAESSGTNTNRPKPNATEESKASAQAIDKAKRLIREGIMIPRWKDSRG